METIPESGGNYHGVWWGLLRCLLGTTLVSGGDIPGVLAVVLVTVAIAFVLCVQCCTDIICLAIIR